MQTQTWKLKTAHLMFRLLDTVAPRVAANRAYSLFTTPQTRRPSTKDQGVMNMGHKLHSSYTDGTLSGYAWGAGPTILMVHGWEGSVQNFTTMVLPLVNAGFRVIAFDAPAHGLSDGATSNLVEYAAALSALITEFGPVYGVVAHSLGGAAMVFMMGTMKHYRIERLVLVGAPCEFNDVLSRFADSLNLTGRSLKHLQRLIQTRLGAPSTAFSVKAMIPYISTSGLVIHDRNDPVIPFSDGETIAAHWPGAEMIVTEGLGHNSTLRHPNIVEQVVKFMADAQPDDWRADYL